MQYGDEPLLPEMHILSCQFSRIIQEFPKFGTNLLLSHMGHQISLLKKTALFGNLVIVFPNYKHKATVLRGNKALAKPAR